MFNHLSRLYGCVDLSAKQIALNQIEEKMKPEKKEKKTHFLGLFDNQSC